MTHRIRRFSRFGSFGSCTLLAVVVLALACTPTPHEQRNPPSNNKRSPRIESVPRPPTTNDAVSRFRGISHEELLRRHTDGGADASTEQVVTFDRPIAPDGTFTDEQPVAIVRARYAITLPDERPRLSTERSLHVDDQGERAFVQLVGTGLPIVPGMRVAARTGLLGFALVSPEGTRYRTMTPDELQQWFLGHRARPGSSVAFRSTDDTIVATRGGLSLVLIGDREGDAHPLTCRIFVALFLGGDPAAARVGCSTATMPVRVTLRAHGWPAVVLERSERRSIQVPRALLAVPPMNATADLPVPSRAPEGAFFAPTELAALGGIRQPQHTLTVTNQMSREALVFVDDLAIGWVAPGHTATFVGLSEGRHAVRARALDGTERSHTTHATFPATVTVTNAVR